MTVIFSIATSNSIIMSADSTLTIDFGEKREYDSCRKAYMVQDIGCVTTWGARDNNFIGRHLESKHDSLIKGSIKDLSYDVYDYLKNEYRPNELGLEDVGFHIGGFDNLGKPKLFHVYWGFERPKSPKQEFQEFSIHDHSPRFNELSFLYNGRNDLAENVINILLNEISIGKESRFNLTTVVDRVCFSDLVMRFASEITPEVGPPFVTYLISKKNEYQILKNERLSPIDTNYVKGALENLNI
jgi:hypothetical protein